MALQNLCNCYLKTGALLAGILVKYAVGQRQNYQYWWLVRRWGKNEGKTGKKFDMYCINPCQSSGQNAGSFLLVGEQLPRFDCHESICFGESSGKDQNLREYCWWFRNPAPVEVVSLSYWLYRGFYTSQVVQDFFQQQYHSWGPWLHCSCADTRGLEDLDPSR